MTDAAEGAGTRYYKRPAIWLLVLTAAYLAIILMIVGKRGQCDGANVPIFFEGLLGLHQHYLSCRPLNELGDFLAGVFAPLALIWLAAAVFIQSQELKAQREQLRAQQEEMKAQKVEMAATARAMEAQATASHATKEFIEEQTEILRKQQALREQEQADEEFDAALLRMDDLFSAGPFKLTFIEPDFARAPGIVGNIGDDVSIDPLEQLSANPIRAFRTLRMSIAQANDHFEGRRGHATKLLDWPEKSLIEMVLHLTMLRKIEERLSSAHALKARGLKIEQTLSAAANLVQRCSRVTVEEAWVTPQKPE